MLISFKNLGKMGFLGNMMFQYSITRYLSEIHNSEFYVPTTELDTHFDLNDIRSEDISLKTYSPAKIFIDKSYKTNVGYDEHVLSIKNADLNGYFQSFAYYKNKEPLKWFKFKQPIIDKNNNKYDNFIDFNNSIGIHIRLGDYKHRNDFLIQSKEYYLSKVDKDKQIIIFSDEPNVAKEYLGRENLNNNFWFMKNSAIDDFYLMTRCKVLVCSSSSLSLFASYMGPTQTHIPDKWFPDNSQFYRNDL